MHGQPNTQAVDSNQTTIAEILMAQKQYGALLTNPNTEMVGISVNQRNISILKNALEWTVVDTEENKIRLKMVMNAKIGVYRLDNIAHSIIQAMVLKAISVETPIRTKLFGVLLKIQRSNGDGVNHLKNHHANIVEN